MMKTNAPVEQALRSRNEKQTPVYNDSDDDVSWCPDVTESIATETKTGDSSEGEDGIGKDETRKIQKMRMFMFFVLAFAVAGALAVFFYLRHLETTKFENQFAEDATKVMSSLGSTMEFTLGALDALAVSFVSYAKETNQTWPFVTIPDFDVRAGKVKEAANGFIINTYAYILDEQREEWENYTSTHDHWVDEAIQIQAEDPYYTGPNPTEYEAWDVIHDYDEYDKENPGEFGTNRTGPYLPWWQCSPVIAYDAPYNWDLMSWPGPAVEDLITTHRASISETYMIAYPNETDKIIDNEQEAEWVKDYISPGEEPMEPIADVMYPLIEGATDKMHFFGNGDYDSKAHKLGGILSLSFYWRDKIGDILPSGSDGVVVVFENPCNPPFTYQINGPRPVYLGTGDFHDPKYDNLELNSPLQDLRKFAIRSSSYSGVPVSDDFCPYNIRVFPSDAMKNSFVSSTPIYISLIAGAVLLVFAGMFFVYDKTVTLRQNLVMSDAAKSAAVVNSMFPKEITKRLMEDVHVSQTRRIKSFLSEGDDNIEVGSAAKPIADLFPSCSVLIADIAVLGTLQKVFSLLETVFQSFDELAKRQKVFKVESVADSYTCVTGLPAPQSNHATLMARFATQCLHKFMDLTRRLETSLGPDTGDLCIRFGIHSGPVTAGVLRGERSRFQLFGDSVNLAKLMQRTCLQNKIQISSATATLLREAGKESWLDRRVDQAATAGRAGVETYWLINPMMGSMSGSRQRISDLAKPGARPSLIENNKKHQRLISWVSDLLLEHARNVVARHQSWGLQPDNPSELIYEPPEGKTCMDEIVEVFQIPEFNKEAAAMEKLHSNVEISSTVANQLRDFVSAIAATYIGNPFHNFEHACHVSMSVDKLLGRIIAPDIDETADAANQTSMAFHLHDFTYGITSDPLSVLAIVFSALIHDVDHRGVSNMQLAIEDEKLAAKYSKSIAEQNSMDIAWAMLMKEEYAELRSALFCTRSEMMRFRQVVVNIVLATDIFDKELNDVRKKRWEQAFTNKEDGNLTPQESKLRATIIIEYIMQASDVCHTMQHWQVYRKFNERLFMELRAAFKAGRMGKDPAEFWVKGEIGFFDNYIIPMAKKLAECKVFGVSSDEYLNYAISNRNEWEARGQECLDEMLAKDGEEVESDSDSDSVVDIVVGEIDV